MRCVGTKYPLFPCQKMSRVGRFDVFCRPSWNFQDANVRGKDNVNDIFSCKEISHRNKLGTIRLETEKRVLTIIG